MYHIKIISPGKHREPWLQHAICEYEKRLRTTMEISWIITHDREQFQAFCAKEPHLIALDVQGTVMSSEQFAFNIYKWLEQQRSKLSFVIGGPEGIPQTLLAKIHTRISFSALTFTHQIMRLLFLEQLYRASEIHKGSSYHK